MAEPLTNKNAVQAALLRPLTPAETAGIDGLMAQASTRLRGKLPTVDQRIASWDESPRPDTALDPDLVSSVLAGVIKRYMVNVEGAASKSRTAGPFSQTTSFASYGKAIGSEGKLEITDDDLADLQPAGAMMARTIRTRPALAEHQRPRRLGCF